MVCIIPAKDAVNLFSVLLESQAMRHVIDKYCERHGSGLFEEPFNTISNLVFIWAAVEAWNLAGRYRVRTRDMSLLMFFAAMHAIILKRVSQLTVAPLS